MNTRRYMPAMLLLFVGSGCAALIYEIVWFQLLQLVIGSSAVSLGVLLGTFMGGMCLGSLLLPRMCRRAQHPLRVYAALELGIGIIGLADALRHAAAVERCTPRMGRHRHRRAVCCAASSPRSACLPPTLLMGATLPAIARWVEDHAGRRVVAGILLRRQHRRRRHRLPARRVLSAARLRHGDRDVRRGRRSTWPSPARLALAGRSLTRHDADDRRPASGTRRQGRRRAGTPGAWAIYVAIGLSGHDGARRRSHLDAHAVAAVRRHGLHLLADPGRLPRSASGIGSSIGCRRSRRAIERPRLALGLCQMLLCAAIAWTAYMLTASLPVLADQPVDRPPVPGSRSSSTSCAALWAMLPAAILWGASFPLALASVAAPRPGSRPPGRRRLCRQHARRDRRGRSAPACCSSIWLGIQRSQQALIIVSAHLGAADARAALVEPRRRRSGAASSPARCCSRAAWSWRRAARPRRSADVPRDARRVRPLRRDAHRPGRASSTWAKA